MRLNAIIKSLCGCFVITTEEDNEIIYTHCGDEDAVSLPRGYGECFVKRIVPEINKTTSSAGVNIIIEKPKYIPTCPFGNNDCILDPSYTKANYPLSYKRLFGDQTPKEISDKSCMIKYLECKDFCDDYDNVDK